MRSPVHLDHVRRDERGRPARDVTDVAHSLDAVLWEAGLVVAVFLGLVLAASATLAAFGVN